MSGGNGASVSIIHDGKKYKKVKRFDSKETANDFMEKNKGHSVLHSDNGGVYVKHDKNKGMPHTYTPHNEETEHLDEISKDLAARAYHGFTAKGDEAYADKSPEGNKKYIETQRGRKAAIDKFHGNSKVPATGPRPANEETEHLDEVSDKKWDESKEKWVSVKRPTFDPKKERGRASTPDQGQKRSDFDEEADLTKIDTKRLQSMVQLHKHMGQKNPASKAAADRGEAELKSRMKKEDVDLDEAASLKDDPSHSNNPFKYTKKPTNKKEAQGNVNYWHYVGMASNKEIEDMGENPASYKTYAKSMMQDAQRELKKMTESFDLDEAVNEKQIRKDLDSGMSHDVVIGKHANKKTDNTDAIRKVIKQHAWDNRKSMKKEEVELDEAYETYHPSYTSAINTALSHHGHLSVSDEDRDHHIASGPRKPSEGNTVSHNIPATDKAGNSHMIHIQVYNKGGNKPFELNTYSSKVPKRKMKEEVDLDEAKTDIYHQHMLKALGKTRLPKDHPYTSAVANNGDFVVHNNGKVVGRLPKGEHSIKEELEALVELSPELLGRYANRATKDASTSLRKITGSTDRSTARPLIARANKRETGADMAIDKIRGNSNVKVHAKEESSLPPHLAKLIDPKTGNMKDPEKQKIYDDMMKRKMKEETESDTKDNSKKFNKVFANKTQATNFADKNGGTVKHNPVTGKYYVQVSESWLHQNEETSSVAKDATVKSTKSNVTANTNTTTPYDVKPQRVKSAEFNKLFN
jgi:hypothetical protein